MMARAFYTVFSGLVLAGIIHIMIIILVPKYGTKDAWAYLSERSKNYEFTQLQNDANALGLSEIDPFFSYGICRYDLNDAPLKMQGDATESFWSASVFDEGGKIIYSLNDRTALNRELSVLVVDQIQGLELKESNWEELDNFILVETNATKGYVVLRALQPDNALVKDSNASENNGSEFLDLVSCEKFDIESVTKAIDS